MGLSHWSLVVLVSLWAFARIVNAQGYFLEPFSCSESQNFQDLGCYDVSTDPFSFAIQNGFVGSDPSRSYANFNGGGNNINSTVTPNYCVAACRAHGFKYASLHNRNCRCGTALGALANARSLDQSCSSTPDPNPCSGDASENCGQSSGGDHARLFVDPSFEPETSLATSGWANVANSFGLLGCFAKPNLPSDDPARDTRQPSTAACLANCAQYGFPLSYMFIDTSNSVNPIRCYCGTDFGVGARSYDDSVNNDSPNDKKCAIDCATGSRTCDPSSEACCGDANYQIYPIYANPRLIGCEIPRIPGYAPIEQIGGPATPVPTEYTCIATPVSISANRDARTQYSTGGTANPTITRSASFVATATVISGVMTSSMINFGCYDINGFSAVSSAGAIATPVPVGSIVNVDVDECANYCYAQGDTWAAVSGPRTGTRCICGDSVVPGLNPIAMDYCNEPCQGTGSQQNCAGQGRALIYAVAVSATTGPWYTSFTNSITTRTYGCTGGVSTSSVITTSTASSSTAASSSTSASTVASTTEITTASSSTIDSTATTSSTMNSTTTSSETTELTTSSSSLSDSSTSSPSPTDSETTTSSTANPSTTSSSVPPDTTSSDSTTSSDTTPSDTTSSETASSSSSESSASSPADSSTSTENMSSSESTTSTDSTTITENTPTASTSPQSTSPESTTPESTTPSESTPEPTPPESTAPETTFPESTTAESTTPESTPPESSAAESSPPETVLPESTPPESTTLETTPLPDSTPTESTPSDSTTSESAPPDSTSTGSTPVENSPTESNTSPQSTPPESSPSLESTTAELTPPQSTAPPESTPPESTSPLSQSAPPNSNPPPESTPPESTPAESTPPESSALPKSSTPQSTPPESTLLGSTPAESTTAKSTSSAETTDSTNNTSSMKNTEIPLTSSMEIPPPSSVSGVTISSSNTKSSTSDIRSLPGETISQPIDTTTSSSQVSTTSSIDKSMLSSPKTSPSSTVVVNHSDSSTITASQFQTTSGLSSTASSNEINSASSTAQGTSITDSLPSSSTQSTGSSALSTSSAIEQSQFIISNTTSANTLYSSTDFSKTLNLGTSQGSIPSPENTISASTPSRTSQSLDTSLSRSAAPSEKELSTIPQTNSSITGTNTPASASNSFTSTNPPVSSRTLSSFIVPTEGTSSSAPITTDLAEPVLLEVSLPNVNNRDPKPQVKRQAGIRGFIDGTGEANKTSCHAAAPFSLVKGELIADGQPVRTGPGIAFIPIRASLEGTISTTFSVTNGILSWTNETFFGGRAGFCQDASGITYATFDSDSTELLDCTPVTIIASLASQCGSGDIVSNNLTTPSIASATMATTGTSRGILISETVLPQASNVYPLNARPAGYECGTTTLSWVTGEATFLGT